VLAFSAMTSYNRLAYDNALRIACKGIASYFRFRRLLVTVFAAILREIESLVRMNRFFGTHP
jgi:hypothetical protein